MPPDVPFSQLNENDLRHVLQFPANERPEQNIAQEWAWQNLLSGLTRDEQTLAYWYYVWDETMARIAVRMNLSEQAVHVIHSRLRDKLHARWKSGRKSTCGGDRSHLPTEL
jgi:DNA-directed RNA polymerase specialized sigma subunit